LKRQQIRRERAQPGIRGNPSGKLPDFWEFEELPALFVGELAWFGDVFVALLLLPATKLRSCRDY
jgi:hypothetical protein